MRIFIPFIWLAFFMNFNAFGQCSKITDKFIEPAKVKRESDPESALLIIEKGISHIESHDYQSCKKELGTAYIVKGIILRNLYRLEEAQDELDKSLTIRKGLKDTIAISSVLSIKGTVYKERGDYENALRTIFEAIAMFTDHDGAVAPAHQDNLGRYYINAANVMIEMDSLQAVEGYLSQAKKLLEKPGIVDEGLVIANHNLALAYIKQGEHIKAEGLLKDCHFYYTSQKDNFALAQVENAFGWLNFTMGFLHDAQVHFKKSIALFESLNNQKEKRFVQLGLARNFLSAKKPDQALALVEQIRFEPDENLYYLIKLERIYIDAYKALGQKKEMLDHVLELNKINREISSSPTEEMGLVETLTETLLELHSYSEFSKQESEKVVRKNLTYAGGFICSVLIVLIVLGRSKIKQQKLDAGKAELKIEEQELEAKKAQFEIERQKLDAENQSQEKKLQEKIANFLKDIRGELTNNTNLLNRTIHDNICPGIINIKRGIEYYIATNDQKTLVESIGFSDHLYEEARALINSKEFTTYTETYLQNLMLIIERYKQFGLFELNDYIDLKGEELPPKVEKELAIIANVLLENIEKHAKAKHASISIIRENGSLEMVVEDDGVGFDPDNIPVKKDNSNHGIGLKNVRHRVEEDLGGIMRIESMSGEGTTITINIPLTKNHKIK